MNLLDTLVNVICSPRVHPGYIIAFSGGLDSSVLLSLCAKLRESHPIKLTAIHINHGLSLHADDWEQHCRTVCDELQVDLIICKLEIKQMKGESLEEVARELRYQAFANVMDEGNVLLTAHHQDDQAETVLLQLLRGAGLKGLAAMPVKKAFASGWQVRPLLAHTRAELEQYAREQQLHWIEDESNQSIRFTRNQIRRELLPYLQQRWPAATATLARSAEHIAEAQALLEEYALEDWKKVIGSKENTLSVAKLLALSPARQRLVMRTWISQSGFTLPNARKLAAIQSDVLSAKWSAMPCVAWGDVELRRYRDDLYLVVSHRSPLPERGGVEIRFGRSCDTVLIPGRGKLSLKNLFQEWGVPPWERSSLPLLFMGDQLIEAVGYYIAPKINPCDS